MNTFICSSGANIAHNKSSFTAAGVVWINDISSSPDVCCFYPPSHYSSSGCHNLNKLTFIFSVRANRAAWLPHAQRPSQKHCRSVTMLLRPSHPNSIKLLNTFYITAVCVLMFFPSRLQNCDASFAYFKLFVSL